MVVLEDVAAMEATALSRGCCWILLEADADARLPVSTEVSLCMRKNGKNFKYECQTCFVEKKYLFNEVCTQISLFSFLHIEAHVRPDSRINLKYLLG